MDIELTWTSLILVASGAIVAAVGLWVLFSFRSRQICALVKAEEREENSRLQERVRGLDLCIQQLRETIDKQQGELGKLQQSLFIESEKRSAAEERNGRIPQLETTIEQKEKQLRDLQDVNLEGAAKLAELEAKGAAEKKAIEEKLLLIQEAEKKWTDLFKALSFDALNSNNQSFLELAKTVLEKQQESARAELEKRQTSFQDLVKPVRESLDKFDSRINELEKTRIGAYESLVQQVRQMTETQNILRSETGNLVKALRSPIGRGRWGEMQLKRVVEMAGMIAHCDFYEQASMSTEEGRLRPDMLVRLPLNKNIIVDAKAPLSAYLEAIESNDEEQRKAFLKDHARQVRMHITALGKKTYWGQFQPSPEFVVLFLPGEIFFSAALEQDPTLIEAGVDENVILATPTTLIALLRAVAYGWTSEAISQNAKKISDMGKELYKRLIGMSDHWKKMGKNLSNTVEAYNQAVGSLESRVLVTARQFQSTGDEIEELEPIEKSPRILQFAEQGLAEFATEHNKMV